MSGRIRRALRLFGVFSVRHPLLLLGLLALGALPGVWWRWGTYGAATDALAFARAQALGALGSVLLAPWFAGALTPAALRDAGRATEVSVPQALSRAASVVVTGAAATVAVLAACAAMLLPGLYVLVLVQQAPCAAAAGRAPWQAFGDSLARSRGRRTEHAGLVYAVAHVSSLLAAYPLVVPLLLAFGGWLASLEILQPVDLPPAGLHAVVDGVLMSACHLPLAVLAAVLYADDEGAPPSRAPTLP